MSQEEDNSRRRTKAIDRRPARGPERGSAEQKMLVVLDDAVSDGAVVSVEESELVFWGQTKDGRLVTARRNSQTGRLTSIDIGNLPDSGEEQIPGNTRYRVDFTQTTDESEGVVTYNDDHDVNVSDDLRAPEELVGTMLSLLRAVGQEPPKDSTLEPATFPPSSPNDSALWLRLSHRAFTHIVSPRPPAQAPASETQ